MWRAVNHWEFRGSTKCLGALLFCARSLQRTKRPFTLWQPQGLRNHFRRCWQILHFQLICLIYASPWPSSPHWVNKKLWCIPFSEAKAKSKKSDSWQTNHSSFLLPNRSKINHSLECKIKGVTGNAFLPYKKIHTNFRNLFLGERGHLTATVCCGNKSKSPHVTSVQPWPCKLRNYSLKKDLESTSEHTDSWLNVVPQLWNQATYLWWLQC